LIGMLIIIVFLGAKMMMMIIITMMIVLIYLITLNFRDTKISRFLDCDISPLCFSRLRDFRKKLSHFNFAILQVRCSLTFKSNRKCSQTDPHLGCFWLYTETISTICRTNSYPQLFFYSDPPSVHTSTIETETIL